MDGMGSGNASFALSSFGTCTTPTVILAFLGPAGFERRPPTLLARAAAVGGAALALDLSASSQKVIFHNYNFMEFRLNTPPK